MKAKAKLSSILVTLRQHLYSGVPKYVIRTLGLESFLVVIYHQLLYIASDDIVTVKVDSGTARFHVSTMWEAALFNNMMEEEVIRDFLTELEQSDVFFDIGANVGLYSCLAAEKLSEGEIIAFEPHPENAKRIKQNLELNSATADIREVALSDTSTTTTMPLNASEPGAVGYLIDDQASEEVQINTERLDEFLEGESLAEPDIVKIDVIGAEYNVLKGMSDLLSSQSPRVIYCEVYPDRLPDFGSSPRQLTELLENNGYNVRTIHEVERAHYIKATRDTTDG